MSVSWILDLFGSIAGETNPITWHFYDELLILSGNVWYKSMKIGMMVENLTPNLLGRNHFSLFQI